MNINAQTYAFAGINMTLDIVIFFLPIPQVSRPRIVEQILQLTESSYGSCRCT
jgi:hypothetical protein